MRMRWRGNGLPIAGLAALASLLLSCTTGCGIHGNPPYPASEYVACFRNAVFAQDEAGRWHLISAEWDFAPELTPADIRYQYREAKVITPGWYDEILQRLKERKK